MDSFLIPAGLGFTVGSLGLGFLPKIHDIQRRENNSLDDSNENLQLESRNQWLERIVKNLSDDKKDFGRENRKGLIKLLEQENNEIGEAEWLGRQNLDAENKSLQSKIKIIEQENKNFRAINQNLNAKIVRERKSVKSFLSEMKILGD